MTTARSSSPSRQLSGSSSSASTGRWSLARATSGCVTTCAARTVIRGSTKIPSIVWCGFAAVEVNGLPVPAGHAFVAPHRSSVRDDLALLRKYLREEGVGGTRRRIAGRLRKLR